MNHIPAELSRPGRCPVPTTPGTCITQCQNDAMCPNNEICCYNGCGFTCSGHQNKPGTCPRYLRNENLCGMDCSSDSDCPGVEKCCMTACGSTCSRPCYYYLFNTANQAAGVRSAFWSLPYICRQLWDEPQWKKPKSFCHTLSITFVCVSVCACVKPSIVFYFYRVQASGDIINGVGTILKRILCLQYFIVQW